MIEVMLIRNSDGTHLDILEFFKRMLLPDFSRVLKRIRTTSTGLDGKEWAMLRVKEARDLEISLDLIKHW